MKNHKIWIKFIILCIIYIGLHMTVNDHNYSKRQYNKDSLIKIHIAKKEGHVLPSISWGKE